MRYLLPLILLLVFNTSANAQDVIVTKNNDFLEVEILRIESTMTFFKKKGSTKTSTLQNKKIKGYQWNANPNKNHVGKSRRLLGRLVEGSKPNALSVGSGLVSLGLGITALFQVKRLFKEERPFFSLGNDRNVEGLSIWKLLGGATIFAVISSATRTKTKHWNGQEHDFVASTLPHELLHENPKRNTRSAYISGSDQGVGIQLNF